MAGFVGFSGAEMHAGSTKVGDAARATSFDEIRKVSQSVDLPSVGANATADAVVAMADVDANDVVILMSAPSLNHGLGVESIVAGAGQITLRVSNVTAGAIDAAAITMIFLVMRVA